MTHRLQHTQPQRGDLQTTRTTHLLEYMALNKRGVNCLREVFEIFLKFNKILCVNPEQKSGYPRI